MRTSTPAGKAASVVPRLPGYLHASDIQGLAQLATQATLGVTGLAENVHGQVYRAVASFFGPAGAKFVDASPGRSGVRPLGVTGLVYGGIRGVTRLAGGAVNAVLSGMVPLAGGKASSRQREAMLAALNGVLGDQLQDTANPLAIHMRLRHEGQALALETTALAQRLPAASAKPLVLIHGLCMNDLQWRTHCTGGAPQPAHDHGLVLARELGYTPVYLHYNSGLHISANGAQLAGLLEQLLAAWPQPVQELALLGHSMGGLLARSAFHQATQAGQAWPAQLKRLVFLGTPHHGAPLERVGHWVDRQLQRRAVTRPFAKIGQIRSAGITDLRHGNLLEADWRHAGRFESAADTRQALPLPAGVACYAVAATTVSHGAGPLMPLRQALSHQLVGDGLVPLASALGLHASPERSLAFAPQRQWIAHGMNHLELLSRPEVSAQLVRWLREPARA
ncbi:esterase/lipase family protein [Polaromonas naphthalenivorans]|uniref:PGAP1 family protein n=1 Tax=Polaromonas naphthalenivorans (strain CJ2) TaxID=365044 RepID=A1VTB2_POLNA|nr:permease [Polaromonas naphthalenivorans]ABM38890.1 PGAP1 family protein [Polaromonas naphthalenivorans CJ2]